MVSTQLEKFGLFLKEGSLKKPTNSVTLPILPRRGVKYPTRILWEACGWQTKVSWIACKKCLVKVILAKEHWPCVDFRNQKNYYLVHKILWFYSIKYVCCTNILSKKKSNNKDIITSPIFPWHSWWSCLHYLCKRSLNSACYI